MESQKKDDDACCPEFDPAPWDDKIIEWDNRKFIKGKVRTLFFIPLNFGNVMRNFDRILKQAGSALTGAVCLSDHTSRWNMDVYLSVDKEIPGIENTTLSGKFLSKVYEGPYGDTGKWCRDFEKLAKSKGLSIKKWYMWYVYCPRCAKKYGKNYTVIISEVAT